MFDAHRNPESWKEKIASAKGSNKSHHTVHLHHTILNAIHDKPLYFAGALSVPLAGTIIYKRMQEPHLTISQALMQSRVV